MKFKTLKATFKGGMVSPRLRGREKDGDLTSTAEKLENFVVDKVGGISKRSGIEMPHVQPFISTNDGAITFDSKPFLETAEAVFFAVFLRGREFILRFDMTKAFNAISNTVNPSTVADYQSTYLTVIEPYSGDYKDARPYAPYYTGAGVTLNNGDLTAFNNSLGTPVVSTQLPYYLSNLFPKPTHISKVTDATVVFSCGNKLNGISNISFTLSLINLPIIAGLTPTTEVFVLLPYFVNVRAFVANLGKALPDTTYYNVVQPTNFPFNVINTNKSFTVSAAVITGQSGANTADKVLSYTGNKLVWEITVPQDMCLDASFVGLTYTSPDALLGKFIIIPSADNTYDCVFFITRFEVTVGTTYKFIAMQITGGTPEPNSSRWKLSTYGGQTHPRAVAYCFNRLIYGNAGVDESAWWASGIHPTAITNFQGFMQFSLVQDKSADVSHLLYEGVATPTATDIYRYGIQSRVPNLAPISFISSRRRIHFGTLSGECQLTINNGTFDAYSFDQLIVRSNSAALAPSPSGDGKFFYLSKEGKDIRFISTEDKDYESVDGLVTTALEGLGLVFNKIEWAEKLNSIVARTVDNRFFFITMHADTEIKAITEIISNFKLIDFTVSLENLYFVFNYKGYTHIGRYGVQQLLSVTDTVKDSELNGDVAVVFPSTTVLQNAYTDLWNFARGETINLFHDGTEYEITVPIGYNGDIGTIVLPIPEANMTESKPGYFYLKRMKVKLRTMPVSEGGGNNTAMGDIVRIDRLIVQVDRSGPFKAGVEDEKIYDAEGLSLAILQTKYIRYDMPQSPDIENHFYIESDKPTPLNISGISFRGVSYQGD